MTKPLRRLLLVAALATGLAPAAAAGEMMPREPPAGRYTYAIVHEEHGEIGTQRMTISRDGPVTTIEVDRRIAIKAAFVTLYSEHTTVREVWKDGVFQSHEREGEGRRIAVVRGAEALEVTGIPGVERLPLDAVPTLPWGQASVLQGLLFDPADGRLLKVRTDLVGGDELEIAGQRVPTLRYDTAGDLKRTLWFDAAGQLLRQDLWRDGKRVTLLLREPPPVFEGPVEAPR